jgi:hypothetical protein
MTRATPDIRLEWLVNTVPSGTDTYRFGRQPYADQDSFTQGRLDSVGIITRRLSSDDGDSHSPSVDVTLPDSDGIIRGILSAVATRNGGGEAAVQIVSEAGRKSGVAWSDLFRGRVVAPKAVPGRMATLRIEGDVGSRFTGLDLNKTIPNARIGAEHPNAPETSVGLVYPLVLGEKADVNATDLNGNSVEKGILPAIDVGDVLMLADGTEVDPADGVITYLDAPTNLQATVNGTAGTTSRVYKVTALSYYGETTAASVTVSTAPDLLNGTDSVTLTWDAVSSAIAYRVYRDNERIALLNNGGTYVNPEETYEDVGLEGEAPGPPSVNTAQIAVTVGAEEAYGWTRFVAAGKACHIEYLYGWDGADGIGPKRARVTGSRIGWDAEVLLPGEADWPHATDYVDIGGIRQTIFYARGPLVTHHRNKSVTLAWNGWGVEDVGDLTGDPIIQAFPGLLWLLNEEVLKDDGEGYRTGDYGPLVEFSNGTPKLRASKFQEAQTKTKGFLGDDVGYVINMALTEPITVRELIHRFHQTFGSHDGTTRFGQFFADVIDDTEQSPEVSDGLSPLQDEDLMTAGNLGDETSSSAPPTGAYVLTAERRSYRDKINIIRYVGETIHRDRVQTQLLFDMSWDADAQRFRMTDQRLTYDHTAYGHAEPKQKAKRRAYFTDDQATAFDAQDRYLRRHLLPPRDVQFAVDYEGLDDELGNEAWFTHYDTSGSDDGDIDTRMLVIGHDPNVNDDEVILTLRDLTRIVPHALSPLQDEDEMTDGLGDEDTLGDAAQLGAG